MAQKPEADKKKVIDKSPENDIGKAIDLIRNARAKYVRQGNEARSNKMLEIINSLQTE